VGKIPWRRNRLPNPVLFSFPGSSDGKQSTCNSGETRVQSLGWKDTLEKGTATDSSILAWRIPWTEKTGRLQFMGVAKSQTQLTDFHITSVQPAQADI